MHPNFWTLKMAKFSFPENVDVHIFNFYSR